MWYVVLIIGAIVDYYLLGWICHDMLTAAFASGQDTLNDLMGRMFLSYAIAATVWFLIMFLIVGKNKNDEKLSDTGASVFVVAAAIPWLAYTFWDKMPMSDGTTVLIWLLTLGSMVTGSIICAKTLS